MDDEKFDRRVLTGVGCVYVLCVLGSLACIGVIIWAAIQLVPAIADLIRSWAQ